MRATARHLDRARRRPRAPGPAQRAQGARQQKLPRSGQGDGLARL